MSVERIAAKRWARSFCVCCALAGFAHALAGPIIIEPSAKVIPPDPGFTVVSDVAIDGNRMIIGAAKYEPIGDIRRNAAYVFERSTSGEWQVASKLFEQADEDWAFFRPRVAIEGNVAAVALYYVAYIFERGSQGWVQSAVLNKPPGVSDMAGDVEISAGTIVLSAQSGTYQALVFRKNAAGVWAQTTTLNASFGEGDAEAIGGDVDISGSRIIMASPESSASYRDEVHVFEGTPWSLKTIFTDTPQFTIPYFGQKVAIDNTLALVSGSGWGGSVLFQRNTITGWAPVARLRVPDSLNAGYIAVPEVAGNRLFLGHPEDDDRGAGSGSINVYEHTGERGRPVLAAKLLPGDSPGAPKQFLGLAVSASGLRVAARGPNAAYVFDLPQLLTQPAIVQEDFADRVADGWEALAASRWSVVASGETSVYRQDDMSGDARAILGSEDRTNQSIEVDAKPLAFATGGDRWFGAMVRYTDAANYYYVTLRTSNTVHLRKIVNGSFASIASAPLAVTAGRSFRVRLEAIGTWLRVYVDGRLLLQARDTAHSHGSPGLAMYKTRAEFDNIVVSSTPSTTLIAEDFEADAASAWLPSGGAWSIATAGSGVYQQASLDGTPHSIIDAAEDETDQIIEADARALSFGAGSNPWFGLAARYLGPSSYVYVTLRSNNTISLRRLESGFIRVLDTAPLPVATGRSYRVRMEAIGDRLRVYVDNRLLLDALDTAEPYLAYGRAGVIMYRTAAQFDNVRWSTP